MGSAFGLRIANPAGGGRGCALTTPHHFGDVSEQAP